MAFAITAELFALFAQPILLFAFSIIVWSLQSFFVTGISRRFIFPQFYSNPITTYLLAQVSIILHEASHFLSAIFTGSSIISEETFVTPTQGKVTAASEESVIGWFSRMIAALAPSFIPPIIFLIVFFSLSGQSPRIVSNFAYSETLYEFQNAIYDNFNDVLIPDVYLFISSMTNLTEPLTFLFIYLLIVCSIAAGPSEGDWKSTLDLLLSPIPTITLFVMFLFFQLVFSQFNLSFVIPLILLISYIFVVVAVGVFYSFLLARFIAVLNRSLVHAAVIMFVFIIIYLSLFYIFQDSLSSFAASIIVSAVLEFLLKSGGKMQKNRNNLHQRSGKSSKEF